MRDNKWWFAAGMAILYVFILIYAEAWVTEWLKKLVGE